VQSLLLRCLNVSGLSFCKMVISQAAVTSQDLSHSAPVFVSCSVAASSPAAATSAGRVRCRVAVLSVCQRSAATQPRHRRRNCRRHHGHTTPDIMRQTTRRGLTRRTPPAKYEVVLQFFRQSHRRCLSVELLIQLFFHCDLSVPMQLIDWRELSAKSPVLSRV